MASSDLIGDLSSRWNNYKENLIHHGYKFDENLRIWSKEAQSKIDERRAADFLFDEFDFYGSDAGEDGVFRKLFYKQKGGPFDYQTDMTIPRARLREHSQQNFKQPYYEEVEAQLMQLCAENGKMIRRSDTYIIVKNKVLSCITDDAYDFEWLGTKPPTDVILPWKWYPRSWVQEHELDLGGFIGNFMVQLSRDTRGRPQPEVEQWLWVIAGASMIPANNLQKIVILSGGGQNGKSLYTSLIRLCLGDDMFNESKIFDSNPHDNKFWGEDLDKGILCVIDDLNRVYNKDAFSYIKGAITGTDTVYINEKFKPKKRLDVLPQIIACTNFDFELYDKSEGMKRRVIILPTEYHVANNVKDDLLQFKLVLNTMNNADVAEYRMKENAFANVGSKVMKMHTRESGVLDSLDHGSLAWFANKARYMYMDWVLGVLRLSESKEMEDRLNGTFSGGPEAEMEDFMEWFVNEHRKHTWSKELYGNYLKWHDFTSTGEAPMKEKSFSMKIGRTVNKLKAKGYDILYKKAKNENGIVANKLFIYGVPEVTPPIDAVATTTTTTDTTTATTTTTENTTTTDTENTTTTTTENTAENSDNK